LSVRIGATLQGRNGKALADQPYEVATVLLVPRGYFPIDQGSQTTLREPVRVEVSSDTQFLDTETGQPLAPAPEHDILKQVDDAITGALRDTVFREMLKKAWLTIDPDIRRRLGRMLAERVREGRIDNFGDYLECVDRELDSTFPPDAEKQDDRTNLAYLHGTLCPIDKDSIKFFQWNKNHRSAEKPPGEKPGEKNVPQNQYTQKTRYGYLSSCTGVDCGYYLDGRLLWTHLSGLLGNAAQQVSVAELKLPAPLEIPAQTAVLNDDGKNAALTLYDVNGDTVTGFLATLGMQWAGKTVEVSGSLGIDRVGHTLTVTFPTLSRLDVSQGNKLGTSINLARRAVI
jgi:hypothetical protein